MLSKAQLFRPSWLQHMIDIEEPLPTNCDETIDILTALDTKVHPLDPESQIHISIAEVVFDICLCYWNGFGTSKNPQEGLAWLASAALLGNDIAMSMYQPCEDSLGVETPMPYPLPRRVWLLLSCLKGFPESGACLERHFPNDLVVIKAIMGFQITLDHECFSQHDPQNNMGSCASRQHHCDLLGFTICLPPQTGFPLLQNLVEREGGMVRSLTLLRHRWCGSEICPSQLDNKLESQLYHFLRIYRSMLLLDSCALSRSLPEMLQSQEINVTAIFAFMIMKHKHVFLNLRWSYGSTLIEKQLNVIQTLLDHGLNPITEVVENTTLLSIAITEGYLEMVRPMMDHLK